MRKIGIVMGSESDLPVARKCAGILKQLGIPFTVNIYSAHRTPAEARVFAENAASEGYGVLIAFAGMAAHLAGVLASCTVLPVIGVPCKGGAMDGLDALLATVQMPSGIPVATVALNGGVNAGILAAQILALSDPELTEKLRGLREDSRRSILEKNRMITDITEE